MHGPMTVKDGGGVGGGGDGLGGGGLGDGGGNEGGGGEGEDGGGEGLGGGGDGGGSGGDGREGDGGGGEGDGGEGEGDGGGGDGDGGGGASRWMVTPVAVGQGELQYTVHVARPCGGEDESLDKKNDLILQTPSPSMSLAAVVLGATSSNRQAGIPALPSSPSQSGSQ